MRKNVAMHYHMSSKGVDCKPYLGGTSGWVLKCVVEVTTSDNEFDVVSDHLEGMARIVEEVSAKGEPKFEEAESSFGEPEAGSAGLQPLRLDSTPPLLIEQKQ